MSLSAAQARPLLKKISGLNILVIGDVILDRYIWGDATRISPEAPVPVVDIQRESHTPGGAANVALNAATLGAKAVVAGGFKKDEAGTLLTSLLKARGVTALATPGQGDTIVKTRVIVQRQQLCRLDRESPPDAYTFDAKTATKLLGPVIKKADAIILSDYAKGVLSDELVAVVTKLARKYGKFVAIDPKPKRDLKFHGVDLITPNRREASQLAGIDWDSRLPFPAEQICTAIHKKYAPKHLVITLSEDGMLLSTDGKISRTIPTAAREVFDVSGAGDTSIAALVLALAAGADLETAANFSNAAAGVVVGKIGTATVTPDELLNYISHTP